MADELVVLEEKNVAAVFQEKGSDPIIAGLKKKLDEFQPDITTKKGRDEIKSFSRKFSTSKVLLDNHGKALTDEYTVKVGVINAERKKLRDTCDEFRDAARQPLTDYENAEKKRVEMLEARVEEISNYGEITFHNYQLSSEVKVALDKLNAIVVDESFEEYELAATKAKQSALNQLEAKFIVLQNTEKEAAETERLEKERLEKEQREREDKIAKEAAETATREAEETAKEEAEEKERKDKEEKDKLEKETLQAKLDKEQAEREKWEAEDKAERDKKEAAERAEKDKVAAVKYEQDRLLRLKQIEDEAETKRQANKKHRKKINNEAKESLRTVLACSEEEAEKIIVIIAKGQISNISINY